MRWTKNCAYMHPFIQHAMQACIHLFSTRYIHTRMCSPIHTCSHIHVHTYMFIHTCSPSMRCRCASIHPAHNAGVHPIRCRHAFIHSAHDAGVHPFIQHAIPCKVTVKYRLKKWEILSVRVLLWKSTLCSRSHMREGHS